MKWWSSGLYGFDDFEDRFMLWGGFVLMALLLTVITMGLLSGCDQLIGKSEQQTVNYAQTVIFDGDGEPIQVLSSDGTYYVSVYEASNDLLIERGLIRIEGRVQPVEVE